MSCNVFDAICGVKALTKWISSCNHLPNFCNSTFNYVKLVISAFQLGLFTLIQIWYPICWLQQSSGLIMIMFCNLLCVYFFHSLSINFYFYISFCCTRVFELPLNSHPVVFHLKTKYWKTPETHRDSRESFRSGLTPDLKENSGSGSRKMFGSRDSIGRCREETHSTPFPDIESGNPTHKYWGGLIYSWWGRWRF